MTELGERSGARGTWVRVATHVLWVLAFSVCVEWQVGRFGFNPTDQGFILSASWRILHGAIPHVDLISARPLGAAYLHTLDFVLPGPLFFSSGVLAMVEIVLGTMAVAALVTRRPVLTWGPVFTVGVAAAALLNAGLLPLMAWHTTDGILLTAGGWWAIDKGLHTQRAWVRWVGLLLLGAAALTKQSFAPAPVVGLVWVLAKTGFTPRRLAWWRELGLDVLAIAVLPLAYFGRIAAAGGLAESVRQLTGGAPADDQRIGQFVVHAAESPLGRATLLLFVVALVLLVVRGFAARLGAVGRAVNILGTLGAILVLCWTVWQGQLVIGGDWALALLWMTCATVLIEGLVTRQPPWRGLLVVLLAALCSLSWGADAPSSVAGSLALTFVVSLTTQLTELSRRDPAPTTTRRWAAVAAIGIIGLSGISTFLVVRQHNRTPYRDESRAALSADLGSVAPTMAGIRTNPAVAANLQQVATCVADHPAANVAVLPDYPFVYSALHLHNPFPLDWAIPQEMIADTRARMLAAAEQLKKAGNYLVLFETVNPDLLAEGKPAPGSVQPDAQIVSDSGIEPQIMNALTGQRIQCGSFIGVYAPA